MGRPPFKPTKAQRERVSVLIAARMAKEDIARAIGIDAKTLDKHFGDELATGIAKKNAVVLGAMFKAAKGGNVAAQKAWMARQDTIPGPPQNAAADDEPTEKLGKKEIADRDAQTAEVGTSWSGILKH